MSMECTIKTEHVGKHLDVWFLKGTSKFFQGNQTQTLRCLYGSQGCTNSEDGLDGGLMGIHLPLSHVLQ